MVRVKRISVLVVDDSAFMRKALVRMLTSDPMIEVVGEAKDGAEALELVRRLRPEVVTLDVQMPGMDGLEALGAIMGENPTPVLMVSSLTTEGGGVTVRALEAGAVDFIDKSSCHTMMDIVSLAQPLVQKVKVLAGVDIRKLGPAGGAQAPAARAKKAPPPSGDRIPSHLVAVGSSTGGPVALEAILRQVPAKYSGAILIVQHMPVGFTRSLADRLNTICPVEVREAEEDDPVVAGRAYIGPAGYQMRIRRDEGAFRIILGKEPQDAQHCPSVDELFDSVAAEWTKPLMGLILTGMGNDGARGVLALKRRGATVLAQDEESCVVFGMPKVAHATGCVDRLVPLNRIAPALLAFP